MHGRHHPGNTSCGLIRQMNRNAKGVYSMFDRKIAFGLQPVLWPTGEGANNKSDSREPPQITNHCSE